MTDWSKRFNALPDHARQIGRAMELKTRIQHLDFEEARLKQRYLRSRKEILEHRQNCVRSLAAMEVNIEN